MTVSIDDLIKNITESGLLSVHELDAFMDTLPPHDKPSNALNMAEVLTRYGKLTQLQATAAFQGKAQGLILGDYVIMTQIGKGGMGQVFKARHRRMNRLVALKVLPPAATVSDTAIKRFRREVEMAAKLTHPNIVTAYDANEHQGVHYLVMELVEGDNLSTAVKKEGIFPIDRAIDVAMQAAEGLAYAHEMGIVHRDIKPSNLLIDRHGTVKILDLGLARVDTNDKADEDARDSLTQTNQVLGTVDFMSPEQSLNARAADHRADIYSLGCTLYRLLTGKNVFFGSTVIEKIVAHREKPIPSLRDMRPDASPELDAVFQRMITKDPAKRTQTMRQVISELQACLSALVPAEPPPGAAKDEAKQAGDSGSLGSATPASRDSMTVKDAAQDEEKSDKPKDSLELPAEPVSEPEDLSINPPSAASEPMAQAPPPKKIRVGLLVGLGVGLAVLPLLIVILAAPRPAPRAYPRLASIGIPGDASRPVRPIAYAGDDAQVMAQFPGKILSVPKDTSTASVRALLTGDLTGAIKDGKGTTLLVSLTAYGFVDQGTPYLLTDDFREAAGTAGRYPLRTLLDELKALPAEWKLLVIDAGPLPRDPRLGMLANEFPRRLAEEVAATGDPNLWVFSAYGPLETSHVLDRWRQSLFGYYVSAALRGQADLDASKTIDLDELVRYVSANVAEFVRIDTGGNESQTPALLWGGGPLTVAEEGKPETDSPAEQIKNILVATSIAADTPRTFAPPQKNAARLQAAIERGWKIRDAWDARSASGEWTFLEFAPHIWREFQEHLIDLELVLRSEPKPDDKALAVTADDLEKNLARLEDLLHDRKSAALETSALAERLVAAQPQVVSGVNDPSSFAMVPRIVWPTGDPYVREIEAIAKKLTEGLSKPKVATGFPEFVNESGVRYGQMAELRMAGRLLKRNPKLAWKTIDESLFTRGLGEQLVASTERFGAELPLGESWAPPWVRERVIRADRLSHEAERDLLYEPKGEEKDVLAKIAEARKEYEQAARESAKVADAQRLRNELLFRLPYYLRWHASTGLKSSDALRSATLAPVSEDLRQLMAHLKKLAAVAALPSAQQLSALEEETRALSAIRARLDQGLQDRQVAPLVTNPHAPGNLWKINHLLATPLVSAPVRAKLLAALSAPAPADYWFRPRRSDMQPLRPAASALANGGLTSAATTAGDWQALLVQAELETLMVDLADVRSPHAGGDSAVSAAFQALKATHEKFQRDSTSQQAEGELWLAYRRLGAELRTWYTDLPIDLAKDVVTVERLDPGRGADRLRRGVVLDTLDHRVRFVDARDAVRVGNPRAADQIRQIQLQGLLLWQEERFLAAANDARAADSQYFKDMARISRKQAEAIQALPPRE